MITSRPAVELATIEDLSALMSLEASFPEGQRWSEESWRSEILGENRRIFVYRDVVLGILGAATFALSGDVVDLHRIVTASARRRLGVARTLLVAGTAWATDRGAGRMLLEVEANNTPALSLYAAEGFHRIAERLDYYGPGAHAVILERQLLP